MTSQQTELTVGTAGWALPASLKDCFGEGASNLARYATRFGGVEVNSSFHRRHRASTWARWAEATPDDFRFCAKMPKTITHVQRLSDCDALLADFVADISGLGSKLAVILVQLPPKLAFDPLIAPQFLDRLRASTIAQIVCEPRHASWFEEGPDRILAERRIARVAADPAPVSAAATPGGWPEFAYWRLHGSPHVYRSSYDEARIAAYASAMRIVPRDAWCIFDNTASSAATGNALALSAVLHGASQTRLARS
jgi:uncharacterized protein YecE (DUF72 family)